MDARNKAITTVTDPNKGTVTSVTDPNGQEVKYTYDVWGKPLSCTGTMAASLGKLNPFRYRGYVFDEETGLYYLRSRYYGSAICRFINSDSSLGKLCRVLAHHVFSYTRNKVVNYRDKFGLEDEACPQCGHSPTLYMSVSLSFEEFDSYIDKIKEHYPVKEMESLAEDIGPGLAEESIEKGLPIAELFGNIVDAIVGIFNHEQANGKDYTAHLLNLYQSYGNDIVSVDISVFGNRREGRRYSMVLNLSNGDSETIKMNATSVFDKMDEGVIYTITSILKNDFGGLKNHLHPDPNISLEEFMSSLEKY